MFIISLILLQAIDGATRADKLESTRAALASVPGLSGISSLRTQDVTAAVKSGDIIVPGLAPDLCTQLPNPIPANTKPVNTPRVAVGKENTALFTCIDGFTGTLTATCTAAGGNIVVSGECKEGGARSLVVVCLDLWWLTL